MDELGWNSQGGVMYGAAYTAKKLGLLCLGHFLQGLKDNCHEDDGKIDDYNDDDGDGAGR